MLKKSLIFGSVALFLTALIALTGCSQATDSSETVYRDTNYLYGTVTADDVKTAVDYAVAAGREVVFTKDLKINNGGAGVIKLRTANIRVEGLVNISGAGLVIDASKANIQYVEAGAIYLRSDVTFIYNGTGEKISGVDTNGRVQYTTDPTVLYNNANAIAVENYTASATADGVIYPNIYVLDTLTIPAGLTAASTPTHTFHVVGKAEVQGNTVLGTWLDLVDESVLTTSGTLGTKITLNGLTPELVKVDNDLTLVANPTQKIQAVEGTGILTIEGGATKIEIGTNAGKVLLADVAIGTAVTVSNNEEGAEVIIPTNLSVGTSGTSSFRSDINKGTIRFGGNVKFDVANSVKLEGPGKVVFDGTVEFAEAATFLNKVEFNNGVTVSGSSKSLSFGDIVLSGAKGITYSGTGSLTLTKGKSITLGERTIGTTTVPATKVLEAGETDVVIAVTTTGTTLGGVPTISVDAEAEVITTLATTLVLGKTNSAAQTFEGPLKVVGGIFQIGDGVELTTTTSKDATLVLDGGVLELDGTTSNGSIALGVAGDSLVTIAPVANSIATLSSTGAVTFAKTGISGSGALLTLGDEENPSPVTIEASKTSASANLDINGVEIDLRYVGTTGGLKLTGSATANIITLRAGANPGKLIIGDDATFPKTGGAGTITNGTISFGTDGGYTIADEEAIGAVAVGSVSGGTLSNVIITGGAVSSDAIINALLTVTVAP
jgi:hypothetical protein